MLPHTNGVGAAWQLSSVSAVSGRIGRTDNVADRVCLTKGPLYFELVKLSDLWYTIIVSNTRFHIGHSSFTVRRTLHIERRPFFCAIRDHRSRMHSMPRRCTSLRLRSEIIGLKRAQATARRGAGTAVRPENQQPDEITPTPSPPHPFTPSPLRLRSPYPATHRPALPRSSFSAASTRSSTVARRLHCRSRVSALTSKSSMALAAVVPASTRAICADAGALPMTRMARSAS